MTGKYPALAGIHAVKNEADGHVWTIGEILRELDNVRSLLREKGLEPASIGSVVFNPRLTRSCGRTRRKTGVYSMDFSVAYFQHAAPDSIRNTIAHETIHTVPGCFNHGKKFQQVARMLDADGYDVSTRDYDEAYTAYREQKREAKPVFYIFCPNCGKKMDKYVRLSPTLKAIIQDKQERFYCPACMSSGLQVIKRMPDGTETALKSV